MPRIGTFSVVALLISALAISPTGAKDTELSVGSGSFQFVDESGNPNRPIPVWYHRPANFSPDGTILFVIHGRGRNASEYRDVWIRHAEELGALLLCPEFSNEYYPQGRQFNMGYMYDSNNRLRNKRKWSFMAVERIFDRVVEANRLAAKDYTIYGHSGGGQFVHRLTIFMPEARYKLAIAANPGWYTMPTREIDYPYGLGGTDVDEEQLQKVFDRRLVVLLGTEDTLTDQENLLNTDEAKAQGPHRFARGHKFFQTGKDAARELNADFKWRLEEVPGAPHSNKAMAPAAAKLIE